MTDRDQAAAQLAALQAGRAAVAARARQPWWYDPALGLLVFGLFCAMAVQNPFVTVGAVALFAGGLQLLMKAYQRATGFWVNGLRTGRTRRATTVWFVVYGVVVVPALVLALAFDQWWALVVAGAVLGMTIALVSRWWTTLYIAELRDEL